MKTNSSSIRKERLSGWKLNSFYQDNVLTKRLVQFQAIHDKSLVLQIKVFYSVRL